MDEVNPSRWLLMAREVGVPGEEGGSNQWSLDHLLLDQDAIPTLIEVKRANNTRTPGGREVVGQMLDYAANAVVYWPVETIRARFEAASEQCGDERLGCFSAAGCRPDQDEPGTLLCLTRWLLPAPPW